MNSQTMTETSDPPESGASYRAKLNDVLTELRTCIPSLRAARPKDMGKDRTENWQGQTSAEMLDEASRPFAYSTHS